MILAKEVGRKAEWCRIRRADCGGLIAKAMDRSDWTEGLLVRHLPIHIGARDNRRREERTALLMNAAADPHVATTLDSVTNMRQHFVEGSLVD